MENAEEYNLNSATPAEKMKGDMDVLKNVVSADGMDTVQKQQVEEQIANISNSIMGSLGKDVSIEKLKENQELLTSLSGKGFEKATEALSQLDAVSKETTGVALDALTKTADAGSQTGQEGHLKETLSKLSNDGKGPVSDRNNDVGRPAILEEKEAPHKDIENKSVLADVLKRQAGR